MRKRIKQVIVVRNDLKMPKGKLAAQVSHASLGALLSTKVKDGDPFHVQIPYSPAISGWLLGEFFKVVLKVESELELEYIYREVLKTSLPHARIVDAGHTVFTEPTLTCIGIGPGFDEDIDPITKNLKLL